MRLRIGFVHSLVLLLFIPAGCNLQSTPTVLPIASAPLSPATSPAATARLSPTDIPAAAPSPTAGPVATATQSGVLAAPTPVGYGTLARQYLVALSEDIGPRVAGTPAEGQAAAYILSAFRDMGYDPVSQPFALNGGSSANVIAIHPGRSSQEIVVGAHYDSVNEGRGADDNASGVGVMLEMAAHMAGVETPYTLRFVAFGAEEVGLDGSDYYVGQMSAQAVHNTLLMVNLDSLVAGNLAYVYGDAGDKGVARDWCLSWAAAQGLDLRTQEGENPDYPAGTTGDWSDHTAFKKRGIPYVYFESTDWALGAKDGFTQVDPRLGENGFIWHTPYDNLDYIEQTFPGRINKRLDLFVTILSHLLTEFQAG
jgi:alkaline phosphatase isozyme conversion protein